MRTKYKKDCLSCKYEPNWEEQKRAMKYSIGHCKWELDKDLNVPKCFFITKNIITKFKDNSGIKIDCPAWKKKGK